MFLRDVQHKTAQPAMLTSRASGCTDSALLLVGEAGFEPAISCPPDTRPNQTRPLPEDADQMLTVPVLDLHFPLI